MALGDFRQRISVGDASENSFQYTGREWDKETGLYFYRARYYDPMEGRFISKDPIGFKGGINLYGYVQNNPTNWIDPQGRFRLFPEIQAAITAAVTLVPAIEYEFPRATDFIVNMVNGNPLSRPGAPGNIDAFVKASYLPK